MLNANNPQVRAKLLDGCFGLERESLRLYEDGYLAQSKHPFSNNSNIVRDFSENQAEINTPVCDSAHKALMSLATYHNQLEQALANQSERELLWPFSNPPFIRREADLPIARYEGEDAYKTVYRQYLSDRYGRYKMAFSGIHMNYSFSEDLLRCAFEESGEDDFGAYKDRLYLDVATRSVVYGWILVAITAASPLLDSSFVEKGRFGDDVFLGLGSVRCSELGYWNNFAPVLDYSTIATYANSIESYVTKGWIQAPSELYFPIRLKPAGANTLDNLRTHGVSHIELRMYDLNPLRPYGLDDRDIVFGQLLLVWLASTPKREYGEVHQVQAVQNFKNAAHFDLKTVRIVMPDGSVCSVVRAARRVIDTMRAFYEGFPQEVIDVLDYQAAKFEDEHNRYTWQVREQFSGGYVKKGLKLAREIQEKALRDIAEGAL